jgi:hypothetical protein
MNVCRIALRSRMKRGAAITAASMQRQEAVDRFTV